MASRRNVLKLIVSFCAGAAFFGSIIGAGLRMAYARAKRVLLPKGTPMSELMHKNPAKLDTRQLDTSPMDEFDVMGQTIYSVDLENWRLTLTGDVEQPQTLTYQEILQLPSIERKVLLVCPGFFAYNGRWKGVSAAALLSKVKLKTNASHVKFSGPKGIRRKSKKFPIEDFTTNQLFLAYQVNGEALPERHGFPVRLVAEDYYGGKWIKYVDKITFIAG